MMSDREGELGKLKMKLIQKKPFLNVFWSKYYKKAFLYALIWKACNTSQNVQARILHKIAKIQLKQTPFSEIDCKKEKQQWKLCCKEPPGDSQINMICKGGTHTHTHSISVPVAVDALSVQSCKRGFCIEVRKRKVSTPLRGKLRVNVHWLEYCICNHKQYVVNIQNSSPNAWKVYFVHAKTGHKSTVNFL